MRAPKPDDAPSVSAGTTVVRSASEDRVARSRRTLGRPTLARIAEPQP